MPKARFTHQQEREIRRELFYKKIPPAEIMAKWKLSDRFLRTIAGGPLTTKHQGIEKSYPS